MRHTLPSLSSISSTQTWSELLGRTPTSKGLLRSRESEGQHGAPHSFPHQRLGKANKGPKQKQAVHHRWALHRAACIKPTQNDPFHSHTEDGLAPFPEGKLDAHILKGASWPEAARCDQPPFRRLSNPIHSENAPVLCPSLKHRSQVRSLRATCEQQTCYRLKCIPPKWYVQVLTPRTNECALIWKQGLCRCSQVEMSPAGLEWP